MGVGSDARTTAIDHDAGVAVRSFDQAWFPDGGTGTVLFQVARATRNHKHPALSYLSFKEAVSRSWVRQSGAPRRFTVHEIHIRSRGGRCREQRGTGRHGFVDY